MAECDLFHFQTFPSFDLLVALLQVSIFQNIFEDSDSNAEIYHLFFLKIFIFYLQSNYSFNFCFFLLHFQYFLYFQLAKLFGLNFKNLNFEI